MVQSISKNLKPVFIPFLSAFFIARLPGTLLKPLSAKLPVADLTTLTGCMYLYGLSALSLAVWGILTAVLYAVIRKQRFDMVMCIWLALFFCGTGVVSLYLTINELVNPRIMLLGLVLNFLFGWVLAAKRCVPDSVQPKDD